MLKIVHRAIQHQPATLGLGHRNSLLRCAARRLGTGDKHLRLLQHRVDLFGSVETMALSQDRPHLVERVEHLGLGWHAPVCPQRAPLHRLQQVLEQAARLELVATDLRREYLPSALQLHAASSGCIQ